MQLNESYHTETAARYTSRNPHSRNDQCCDACANVLFHRELPNQFHERKSSPLSTQWLARLMSFIASFQSHNHLNQLPIGIEIIFFVARLGTARAATKKSSLEKHFHFAFLRCGALPFLFSPPFPLVRFAPSIHQRKMG